MDAYECDNHEQRDNRRKVRIVKNGDPSSMIACVLKDHISFEDLSDIILNSINCIKTEDSKIRVFKMGGVEIFDEDVQYIKDGDILYVSFGEEFDESSNFAVYKMIRCIGEGGYGKVFEAKNIITKEKVAIKMIDCQKIQNAKDTEMIYKELIALKNLNHKSILKVFNCFTLQKEMKVALVLEYLEGGDLKGYMEKQKILSEIESQRLFQQLFYAMSYCHKENVIHRDLKLENIMFEDKNHEKLKVVDFGISGRQSLVNVDFTEAGSIRYIAPEVLTSHAPAMPSIDIWAMGCILFWMLTGNSPFPQTTRDAVQDAILKGKWSFSQDDKKKLTKSVQSLVSSMLVKNPKNRITMGEIAEHPWIQKSIEEIIQDEKITEVQEKLLEQERDQALVLQAIRKKSTFNTNNNNNTMQAMNEIKNMVNYYSSSQSPRRSIATPSARGFHKSSFQNEFPVAASPSRSYGSYQQTPYQSSPYYATQEQNKSILPKIQQQQQPRRNSFDPHIQIQSNSYQTTRNGGEQSNQNPLHIQQQPVLKGRILRFNGSNLSNIQKESSPDPLNKPLYIPNTGRKNSLFKHSSSSQRQNSPGISSGQGQRQGQQIIGFESLENYRTQPDNQQTNTPQSAPSHGRSSFYEKAKLSPTKEKHRIILSGRPLVKQ